MTSFKPFATRILVGFTGTLVGAAICFGAAASPAEARSTDRLSSANGPTVIVSYADLDIASPAGRAALDRRINHAARQVCPDIVSADLKLASMQRDCVRLAVANATMPTRR